MAVNMEMTPEEREFNLKTIRAEYEMALKTRKEREQKLREAENPDGTRKYTPSQIKKEMQLLTSSEEEIISKYVLCGGDIDELTGKKPAKKTTLKKEEEKSARQLLAEINEPKSVVRQLEEANIDEDRMETETIIERDYSVIPDTSDFKVLETFDNVPLPSNGEGYTSKISRLPVAYITAWDENMIIAPNLYADNKLIDTMLSAKIKDKAINPLDLLEGDRDAIVLFLRANAYGNEYPLVATDDKTGTEFETVINLADLHYKEFNLKGDANGWFDFELPVSKKLVKFRFPTHRDTLSLAMLDEIEEKKTMKERIKTMVGVLKEFVEKSSGTKESKVKLRQSVNAIENWGDEMDEGKSILFTHTLTNKLELLVMSVDGNRDEEYIKTFVRNMCPRDASELRKYINENEPGIDFNIEVKRPESLGGGSFKTFLQFDQFVFLTIA